MNYGAGEMMMGGETFDALQCIRAGVSCKCILFKPGVAVTPGTPLVFETAEAATNALKKVELAPHESVKIILTDDTMYQNYCNMFEFDVVPTADDGVKLMQEVFSEKNPLIRVASDDDPSGTDVQRGYMYMFAGGMSAI